MSKILIIDDGIANKLMDNIDHKGRLGELRFPNDFDKESFYKRIEFAKNNPYFDLTPVYHKLGGSSSREVLILSDPKCALSSNDVYKYTEEDFESQNKMYFRDNPESLAVLKENFDFENIVNRIKKINPDIILLDLGITSYVPPDKRKEILGIYSEKLKNPVTVANIPIDKQYPGMFNGPFIKYSPDEKERDQDELDYLLDCAGGVILGHYLKKENIPFRLWTADYGHGAENLILAHTLDLVSTADLADFMSVYIHRYADPKTHDDYSGYFANKSKSIICGLKDEFGFGYADNKKPDFFNGTTKSIDLILDGMD